MNRLQNCALIIRHCKQERLCDPINGGNACLRNNDGLIVAAHYLAKRGYGHVYHSTTSRMLCFALKST